MTFVLSETLTKPEKRLIEHGHKDAVRAARVAMHQTMRGQLVDIVRDVVNRPVGSLHLNHDPEADVMAIVCVFSGH